MKYILAVLGLAAYATAQSVSACGGKAQTCLDNAAASSGICQTGDWACGCANMQSLQASATTCVLEACGGATGALAVLTEVQNICANLPSDAPPADSPPADAPPAAEPAPETADDSGSAEKPATPTTMATVPATTGKAKPTSTFAVVNGAGAAAPIAAMVLGAAVLAL